MDKGSKDIGCYPAYIYRMGAKKPVIIEDLHLHGAAAKGNAVGRDSEGRIVFVKGAVPGDTVRVRVVKKKKQFLEAKLLEVTEFSAMRTEPECTHFDLCGGCSWQNLKYEHQLENKHSEVVNNLKRLGHIEPEEVESILPAPQTFLYRNKLEYSFCAERWLTDEEIQSKESFDRRAFGFHIPGRWDRVFEVEKCLLQPEPSNAIRNFISKLAIERDWTYYHPRERTGFLRSLMIRNNSKLQFMLALQCSEDRREDIHFLLDRIKEEFPQVSSIYYAINEKANDSIYDLNLIHYSGDEVLIESMRGFEGGKDLKFRIGPKSFYQTNSQQASELYRIALEFADLKEEGLVYDLYTGTGTIALYLAQKAKKVVGIEGVEEAVIDARINARENGIENVEFFSGDMRKVLNAAFLEENGMPEVIVTDPPREGMHPDVVQQIININAQKIVYVSCNSATQARDLAMLSEKYRIVKVKAVDMFPHTAHIENVALLLRK